MGLEERKLDFQEADRRCAELKRQLDAGIISEEEFDAQRKKLMVQDDEGRWWAKSRETDEWFYRHQSGWVQGTPPGYQPYQASPTDDTQEQQAQPEHNERPLSRRAAREDDKPRWRRRWVILPILLLLLLLLGGAAYALTRGTNENEDVAIPDLVGASSVEEAQRRAGGDFEVVEGESVESRERIGTVVEQDPAAGKTAGESSTISVNVSKGVDLPDVEGEPREEAVRILEGADLEVEEEVEESSAGNKGYVTEQDPQGGKGETAEAGSTITITVGAGPATTLASPAPKQTPPPPAVKNVEKARPEPPPPAVKNIEEPKPEPPPLPQQLPPQLPPPPPPPPSPPPPSPPPPP
jgi:PASTA domain/Short C-terminal domain